MLHPIAGIDYGNAKTNIDLDTGIRYGVISLNSISGEYLNDFDSVYDDRDHEYSYPLHFAYERDGYVLQYSPDSSWLFVFSSPYVTECKFCSPCVPGAGDLNNPINGGIKTYCLDASWFDDNKAPYEYKTR